MQSQATLPNQKKAVGLRLGSYAHYSQGMESLT